MKKIKIKDIYIIKPVKLKKKNRYFKYYFPYNILYKLNIISRSNKIDKKNIVNKIKYKISANIPEYTHKSALICNQRYFSFDPNDITFAITKDNKYKTFITEYEDIFQNKNYKMEGIDEFYDINEINNLVIRKDIFEPENLASYLLSKEKQNESFEEYQKIKKQLEESEYSFEQLKKLKEEIISKEKNLSYLVTTEKTQNYVSPPFYNKIHAYDKKGNKIGPKVKTKTNKINIT